MLRNLVMRSRLALVVIASAAVVAACSGKGNTPAAPSTAAPAAQPSAAGSATISGTVVGVTTASQIKAQRTGLNVTVTGSPAAASVDDSGRFTLTNVPAGHIDLHFTGIGVDAHVTVDVAERSTLVIVVRVSGNEAHLEDNGSGPNPGADNRDAEVNGTIIAGSLAGSCAARNLAFTVGSTRVVTSASTIFRDGTCDSLKAGSKVEVKGTRQSDGSVTATSIEVDGANGDDNDEDDNDSEVELKGAIAAGSLTGACASNTLSFIVGSTRVNTSASTEFKDAACTSLKAGDSVEVKGTRQANANVLARRVERKN
jgi:hypothetical protein